MEEVNAYHVNVESNYSFDGSHAFKLIHSTLTYLFENCLTKWKKGDQYPEFKLLKIMKKSFIISTKSILICSNFSYSYGHNNINNVFVKRCQQIEKYDFNQNDLVCVEGLLSMYKHIGKGKKKALVRKKYSPKFVEDIDQFKNLIQEKTGVFPDTLSLQPVYIDKNQISNNKQINSAFVINFTGKVVDPEKVLSLSYRSVGNDIGYGFGALQVKKLHE
jgi:hypothetical protein